jgi:hypothetical protein
VKNKIKSLAKEIDKISKSDKAQKKENELKLNEAKLNALIVNTVNSVEQNLVSKLETDKKELNYCLDAIKTYIDKDNTFSKEKKKKFIEYSQFFKQTLNGSVQDLHYNFSIIYAENYFNKIKEIFNHNQDPQIMIILGDFNNTLEKIKDSILYNIKTQMVRQNSSLNNISAEKIFEVIKENFRDKNFKFTQPPATAVTQTQVGASTNTTTATPITTVNTTTTTTSTGTTTTTGAELFKKPSNKVLEDTALEQFKNYVSVEKFKDIINSKEMTDFRSKFISLHMAIETIDDLKKNDYFSMIASFAYDQDPKKVFLSLMHPSFIRVIKFMLEKLKSLGKNSDSMGVDLSCLNNIDEFINEIKKIKQLCFKEDVFLLNLFKENEASFNKAITPVINQNSNNSSPSLYN